ncbi:MAG: radical SAM protein [Candidatus Aenigmarchaeota archaeon]|nr:radical SAM protein [Candidatus Aenigmarchaeota archaeon]
MMLPVIQREFVVQWHLTHRCDMRCRFCYIPHKLKSMSTEEIDFPTKAAVSILDQISNFAKKLGLIPRINFSGGNPLLHPDFFHIVEQATEKGIRIGILGNPTASKRELKKLKELNIFRYQISIDGLEKTHDFFRGRGQFKNAIKFLKLEGKIGITRVVLSTVSEINYKEIPELAYYLYKNRLVEIYDFARLVPIGEGTTFKNTLLSTEKFKWLLYGMFLKYKKLWEEGIKCHIGNKEPLWALLYYELGILNPEYKKIKRIRGGCSIGRTGLVIDVNGDIYPCRRAPIILGNIITDPNLTIEKAFVHLLKNFRIKENYECKDCKLFNICRGCPAISMALTNDVFNRDPNCWKMVK